MWAAAGGHTEIACALILASADINATDKNGETALMKAKKMALRQKSRVNDGEVSCLSLRRR